MFFGLPRSNNDVNVLDRSSLVHNMLASEIRDMHFTINGCKYDRYYMFIDGIYLEWSCFDQSIRLLPNEKMAHFCKASRGGLEVCGVLFWSSPSSFCNHP
jgi:hypothetical protein